MRTVAASATSRRAFPDLKGRGRPADATTHEHRRTGRVELCDRGVVRELPGRAAVARHRQAAMQRAQPLAYDDSREEKGLGEPGPVRVG